MRYADTETRQMCEGRDLGGTREAAERQREGGREGGERERGGILSVGVMCPGAGCSLGRAAAAQRESEIVRARRERQ